MKKWLCLLMILTLAMTMLFVACNQGGEHEKSSEQGTTVQNGKHESEQGTTAQSEKEENNQKPVEIQRPNWIWDASLEDTPYKLEYSSYANVESECWLARVIINPKIDQPLAIEIPEKVPDGQACGGYTVVSIIKIAQSIADTPFLFPFVICEDTYESLCAELKETGMNDFDYATFTAYYKKCSLADCTNDQERQALLEIYPFAAGGDAYVFDPNATRVEMSKIGNYYMNCLHWTDERSEQCYNEIIEMAKSTDMLEETKYFISTILDVAAERSLKLVSSITIPDSVQSIGESAFSGCTGLTSITIPDSVQGIGSYAFSGCTGLTNMTIPDGITMITPSAFSGCTGLTSITIPNSVESIRQYAFSGCTGLTDIMIPDSVTKISPYAFSGCAGLTSMTVSNGNTKYHSAGNCIIETQSKALIAGCQTSVIPADGSVTSIDDFAFSGCTGLTSITIPVSVTRIANDAFYGCTELKDVYFTGTEQEWSVIKIGNQNESIKTATIHYNYVPEE